MIKRTSFGNILLLKNKKLKEVAIEEPIATPVGNILLINEKKVIELSRTVMTFNINTTLIPKEINISKEQLSYSFELIYEKEYIFFCKNKEEFCHWSKIIGNECKTYGVFKFPLDAAIRKSRWKVPNIVYRCIEFLKEHNGSDIEGIFRMNGKVGRIEELKKMAENDEDICFNDDDPCYLATSFLKLYLRSMAEPLIPSEYFEYYAHLPQGGMDSKEFINSLPNSNQNTLWYIGEYLMEIISKKDINKMDESNLATCIGLVICDNPTVSTLGELDFTKKAIGAFEYLLKNFKEAFSDIIKRNEANGVEPPKYPAFQPLMHLPFNILTEQIKMELRDIKKSRRLSASLLTDKKTKRKRAGSSLSISSTTSAMRKEYLKSKYKYNTSFEDLSVMIENGDKSPKVNNKNTPIPFTFKSARSKTIQLPSLAKQFSLSEQNKSPQPISPTEPDSNIYSPHVAHTTPKPPEEPIDEIELNTNPDLQ